MMNNSLLPVCFFDVSSRSGWRYAKGIVVYCVDDHGVLSAQFGALELQWRSAKLEERLSVVVIRAVGR